MEPISYHLRLPNKLINFWEHFAEFQHDIHLAVSTIEITSA